MGETWLPLTDYSTKYRVSISTLRRRIKGERIKFRFEDGKYMILDNPPEREPSLARVPNEILSVVAVDPNFKEESRSTNELLEELKKAYRLILQEKEEQILQLREEITDLRTLSRVLESETERLNALVNKQGASNDAPVPLF